jgi:MFS family permease
MNAAIDTIRPIVTTRRLTVLLALAIFINYVDRGSLGTAAPLLTKELHISDAQMGILLSAFFWSYTPIQLLVGWLVERFGARWLLAGGVALWSLATVLTGFIGSFSSLLCFRILLGIGEGVFFPCSSKVLSQTVALTERGRANSMIAFGLALGPAAGTYFGGLLMAGGEWRRVFIIFGVVSLLWLWPWLTTRLPATTPPAERIATNSPRLIEILSQRSAWGAALGHFCSNYGLYFVMTWLPSYLVNERHFSMTEMGQLGGIVYLLQACASVSCGWLIDRSIRRGVSSNRAYKTVMAVSGIGLGTCFIGCALGGATLATFSILAAGIFIGVGASGIFSIAQTLAGPHASGRWVGFQNFVGNLAGVTAPAVTGFMVKETHHFASAFLTASAVVLVGVIAWTFLVRSISPIAWGEKK